MAAPACAFGFTSPDPLPEGNDPLPVYVADNLEGNRWTLVQAHHPMMRD